MGEWKRVKIGDILKEVSREKKIDPNTKYGLLGVKWYGKGVFLREEKYGKEIKATKLYQVKQGDFIYNRLFAWKSSFAIVPQEFDGCLVSNEFPLFTCHEGELLPEFLLSYILLPENIAAINNLSGGMSSVSRKRFKENDFLNFEVPQYDIETQNKICQRLKKVSELLITQGLESTHQLALIKQLRQTVLQEAIEGKLTAKWRDEHPDLISGDNRASKLLEKIKAEKERLIKEGNPSTSLRTRIKKDKPHAPITDAEKLFDLPEGWEWCRLGDCAINKDDARQPISQSERERKEKKYPYYGASGIIDKIDGFTHEGENLLIGEDGANLVSRSTPIAFAADGQYWVNNHAHVLGFVEEITLRFIETHINAIDLTPYVTGGFQPKLSQGNLNTILISFPPLAEQQAIVERVDKLMTMIDGLEKQVSERKEQSEMLMQSVLREAFAR